MLQNIKNIVWSPATIVLIALLGITLSLKTRFRALSHPIKKFKSTIFAKDKNVSSFESMCTALGGTIGVGNTVGVAGAISEGGPGALFWMLTASLFGMVIKEAEIFLAVKYRPVNSKYSGPMYYIERGIGSKAFAKAWAFLCIMTAFGMGNFSQSMSCVNSVHRTTGLNKAFVSMLVSSIVFLALSAGLVGIKKIVSSSVPVLSIMFVAFSLIILFIQREKIPSAISEIFKSALNLQNGIAGLKWSVFAATLRSGFSRGVFTNEAGLGSASIVHSTSNESSPEKQAVWGVVEVFIDTVVICTLTGLMILTSEIDYTSSDFENITISVFEHSTGRLGAAFYTVSTLFFALASILAWYYYSECALEYIGVGKKFILVFKILFVTASFLGGIISAENILYLSDIFNALMLITNLSAMFLLSDKAKSD